MLKQYFQSLYSRTMRESYDLASEGIFSVMRNRNGKVLDCGALQGAWYKKLHEEIGLEKDNYIGIEWSQENVKKALDEGINIIQGDLNEPLPFGDNEFTCIFALSVLEHLLNGCQFMRECHRTLRKDGTFILLTPNISTFFTIAQLLVGKMSSSGPHPDSSHLLHSENYNVSSYDFQYDAESDTPVSRHLVVFSYLILKRYLKMIGFSSVRGYGFGLYPFPNFMQKFFERIDPFHCHQMVFIARK